MKRLLRVNPSDAVPIWRQIEEGVQRLVASGALARGAPVPSVRELAKYLRVNPATVAKAYQKLADSGVLMVKRGEGTFVHESPPPLKKEEKDRILLKGATRYASMAITLGVEREDAVAKLESSWLSLSREGGRS